MVFQAKNGAPNGGALVVIGENILTYPSWLPERAGAWAPEGAAAEVFCEEFFLICEGRGRIPTHGTAQRKATHWYKKRLAGAV